MIALKEKKAQTWGKLHGVEEIVQGCFFFFKLLQLYLTLCILKAYTHKEMLSTNYFSQRVDNLLNLVSALLTLCFYL